MHRVPEEIEKLESASVSLGKRHLVSVDVTSMIFITSSSS